MNTANALTTTAGAFNASAGQSPYSISNYLYLIRLLAIISIVLMSFISLEHAAMRDVVAANEKSLGSLLLMAELKQLLSAVSSIDIAFIEGAIKDIVTSLDKAENLLFVSGILTSLQMLIIKLSLMDVIKYAVVVCFVTSFIGLLQRISLKALLVLLMLSPGLTFYSNTVHFLADDMARVIEGDLYSKLSHLTQELDKEKNTLLKKHQADLKKINHSHSDFKWFHRLIADVSYDFDDIKDTVEGDYSTLITVLRGGGKAILKETIGYFTKLLFLTLLLPLGYFYLLYAVVRYAFPKAPYTEVQLLDKLEQEVKTNRHHLLACIQARHNIFSGVAHWLKHLLITPVENKIKQEGAKIKQEVQALNQQIRQDIEQKVTDAEATVKHDIQQQVASLEQSVANDVRFVQQSVRNAVQTRVNHLNHFLLQLNAELKQHINRVLTGLLDEVQDEVKGEIKQEYRRVLSALEHAVQQRLLSINDALQLLAQHAEQSLQWQLHHALNGAEQELKAEQERIVNQIQANFSTVLQHGESDLSRALQELESKAESLGLDLNSGKGQGLHQALQNALKDFQSKSQETEHEVVAQVKQHIEDLKTKLATKS